MEDVLEVYSRPYDPKYPQVCMDELHKQLIKETRTPIAIRPGEAEKYDSEYERNGTANIFMAIEPINGKKIVSVTERRTKIDWAHFMQMLIDNHYYDAEKIVLVSDNLNTHNPSSFYEAFPPKKAKRLIDKIEFHYTPKHGSWLNMAEIGLSILSKQCLNRRIPNMDTLISEVDAWKKIDSKKPCTVNWRFTTENARIKLKKLYPTIESC